MEQLKRLKITAMGKQAKCKLTGFNGIITGYCQYVTGCDQVLITPKMTDNKYPEGQWLDVNRIEVKSNSKAIVLDTEVDKGAMDNPAIK